jgi:hypothetical protein
VSLALRHGMRGTGDRLRSEQVSVAGDGGLATSYIVERRAMAAPTAASRWSSLKGLSTWPSKPAAWVR